MHSRYLKIFPKYKRTPTELKPSHIKKKEINESMSMNLKINNLPSFEDIIKDFDLELFKIILSHIEESITNNNISFPFPIKNIEEILISNLNVIDISTKARVVNLLVMKMKQKVNEKNLSIIYSDFLSLMNCLKFREYYLYMQAFGQIRQQNPNAFPEFFNEVNIFDKGDHDCFSSMEDLHLLVDLIKSRIFPIEFINQDTLGKISKIIHSSKESFTSMIFSDVIFLAILFYERYGKITAHLLSDAILKANQFLQCFLLNYHMLDTKLQSELMSMIDMLLYYLCIYEDHPSTIEVFHNTSMIRLLLNNYSLKVIGRPINYARESRIWLKLARDLKIKDTPLWMTVAAKLNEFLPNNMVSLIPNKTGGQYIEIFDVYAFVNYGMLVTIFSLVEYTDAEFWEKVFSRMEKHLGLKTRNPIILLWFIKDNFSEIISNEKFILTWKTFLRHLDPSLEYLLGNDYIRQFLLEMNLKKEYFIEGELMSGTGLNLIKLSDPGGIRNENKLDSAQYKTCLEIIANDNTFNQENSNSSSNSKLSCLSFLFTFVNILKFQISQDTTAIHFLSQIIINILLQSRQSNSKTLKNIYELFDTNTQERLKGYILQYINTFINDTEKVSLIIPLLKSSAILTQIDVVQFIFKLEKENVLTSSLKNILTG